MRKKALLIIGIFLLVGMALAYGDYGDRTARYFARLNYLSGQVLIERAGAEGFEDAVVNMPIEEGDRLITADGRAEIYVGFSTFIRLDRNTKMDLLVLPAQNGRKRFVARLIYGRIYLISFREKLKTTIEVKDAEFRPLEKGSYVVIDQENYMEFQVIEGYAELRAGRESLDIAERERVYIQGYEIYGPERLREYNDDFYRWNMERDRKISQGYTYSRYLPPELSDYGWELSSYGRWRYLPPYGWVWVPAYTPCPDWRPYYYGRWVWVPDGWFWVGYEPWGWVVYHYGRWGWSAGIGWYWIPRPYWSYAWVDWFWFDDYVGWVPLDIYGRPIIVINNVVYNYYDYVPLNAYSAVIVRRDMLAASNIRRVALRKSQFRAVGVTRARVSSSPPPLRPVFAVKKTSMGPKRVIAGVKPVAMSKGRFSTATRPSATFIGGATSKRRVSSRGGFSSGTYRRATASSKSSWSSSTVRRGSKTTSSTRGAWYRRKAQSSSRTNKGSSSGGFTNVQKKKSGAVKKKKEQSAYYPSYGRNYTGYHRATTSRGKRSGNGNYWHPRSSRSYGSYTGRHRSYAGSRSAGYTRRKTSFWGKLWNGVTRGSSYGSRRRSTSSSSWGHSRSYSSGSRSRSSSWGSHSFHRGSSYSSSHRSSGSSARKRH